MSVPTPSKRARFRLACEPCRRKKSKCPGERPTCSFCARLGKPCVYAHGIVTQPSNSAAAAPDEGPGSEAINIQQIEGRIQDLETQLTEVRATVAQRQPQKQSSILISPNLSVQTASPPFLEEVYPRQSISKLPSWHVINTAAQNYLLYCDCQPLPLFHRDSFLLTLRSRDVELLFSILAVAIRFSDGSCSRPDMTRLTKGYAETARAKVMGRISGGQVEFSTLQSLCLLSFVDFTHGYKHRASIHINLAMSLAHSARLDSESWPIISDPMAEERRRCFWSVLMLKRLQGADDMIFNFPGESKFPNYPTSTGSSPIEVREGRVTPSAHGSEAIDGEVKDAGIMAYAIRLSELWFQTNRYARRRGAPSKLPPWSPTSEYATILAQQMELETCMPYKHRFKPAAFAKFSGSELQQNRDYWGPWLFMQFLYHTNLCLLNHPLILSLRLRNIRNVIPEIFLQNSSDLISSHTSWVTHLIGLVKTKSYKVSDPFLGHCAAIVATIYLQESFAEDPDVRSEKASHFTACLEFIQEFGPQWPHMSRLAEKLRQLQATVSASYHHRNPSSQTPTKSLLIDLARFWEILDYSSASEVHDSVGQLFGQSLYLAPQTTNQVSNTSTLPTPTRVGSANITAGLYGPGRVNHQQEPFHLPDTMSLDAQSNFSFDGNFGGIPYSNDELEVLADSLFNQRQDLAADTEDWWRTGNL